MRTAVSQKVGNRRLLKLAAFLRGLPREKFDYARWVSDERQVRGRPCGTVCCAGGWCPRVFPRQWQWINTYDFGLVLPCLREGSSGAVVGDLAIFFGITHTEAEYLFLPRRGNDLGIDASPAQVARHIERFVARRAAE